MKHKKWRWAGTGVLIILILGFVAYLLKPVFLPNPSAYRVIPGDAILTGKTHNLSKTFTEFAQTSLWKELNKQKELREFEKKFYYLDSLVHIHHVFGSLIEENPLYFSLHRTSVDQLGLIFCIQSNGHDIGKDIKALLDSLPGEFNIHNRGLLNYSISDVARGKKHLFTFASIQGILVIGVNPVLVEDAVRTYHLRKKTDTAPGKFEQALGNGEKDRLVVRYPNLPALFKVFMDPSKREQVEDLKDFATIGNYRWDFTGHELKIFGPVYTSDTLMNYLALWKNQETISPRIPEVVPLRTALLFDFSLTDPDQFFQDRKKYAQMQGNYLQFKQMKNKIENQGNFSLQDEILPLFGDEWAMGINEPVSKSFRDRLFMVMHTRKPEKVINALSSLNQRVEEKKMFRTKPVEYRGYPVKRLALTGIFPFLFGKWFRPFDQPFYTRVKEFIIFSPDKENLKRMLDDYLASQTLKASANYTRLKESLLSESQFTFYLNPSRALQIPLHYIDPPKKKFLRSFFPQLTKFSAFAYQLAGDRGDFYNQVTIQHSSLEPLATEIMWEQKLDTTLAEPPRIVANHNTGEKELWVKDEKNQVYLMDVSGNILWKRSFREPVLQGMEQIDLYKNGNLQYAFATKSHLQLVDRLGRDVATFPIRLSAPAAQRLSVFDYYDSKEYLYFIGCRNNAIYGYYTGGKPLRGWKPQRINAPLEHPIKYFIFRGTTYLFGITQKGTFYLWNEEGEEVIDPVKLNTRFPYPFEIHFGEDKSSTYLVSADTSGLTRFVYLDGKTEKMQYGSFSKLKYFDFLDINHDGEKELLFGKNTNLTAFKKDSSMVWSLTLPDSLYQHPRLTRIGGRYRVGYCAPETKKLYLINTDGTLYPGFPVEGNIDFTTGDLNQDGNIELVTGNGAGRLLLYRLE